jgi:hypothetical protein
MVQTAVRLPHQMNERLKQSPLGVSDEIRKRLERTFWDDQFDAHTRLLMAEIGRLAELVKLDTNADWHSHAAANHAFRQAVVSLLAHFGQPSGEPVFAPDELPERRLVTSDNPTTIGIGLAAIAYHNRPLANDERREVEDRNTKDNLSRQGLGPVSSLFRKIDKNQGGKS